jgi:ribosomal-protein-alanine N-acetyltransferase
MEQRTRRLRLLAATAETVEAELEDASRLAALIGAQVPDDWPSATLRDALPLLRKWHEEHPDWTGWLGWYAIRLDQGAPVLCGSLGFSGPPDADGTVEIGYSVLPAHQRQGIATEMVGKLLQWAAGQAGVGGVEAETAAANRASVRVLERNGFRVVRAEGDTGSVRYRRP